MYGLERKIRSDDLEEVSQGLKEYLEASVSHYLEDFDVNFDADYNYDVDLKSRNHREIHYDVNFLDSDLVLGIGVTVEETFRNGNMKEPVRTFEFEYLSDSSGGSMKFKNIMQRLEGEFPSDAKLRETDEYFFALDKS